MSPCIELTFLVIYLGPGWDSISPSAHRSRTHSLTRIHCSRACASGASSGLSLLSLPFVDRVLWWYISVACVMLVMVVVWLHPWRGRDVRGVLVRVWWCVCVGILWPLRSQVVGQPWPCGSPSRARPGGASWRSPSRSPSALWRRRGGPSSSSARSCRSRGGSCSRPCRWR